MYPFHHSIHNCRLATSSTSSTESSPNRLVINGGGGGGGSSSSRSHIDAYDDPYVNANASTSGPSTQFSATAVAAATGSATAVSPPLPQCDVLSSTSILATSSLQPISHSVRDLLELDKTKRLKLDRKFDIDDTCSNDAFIFNASLKESPLKNNPKTATVPSNASK